MSAGSCVLIAIPLLLAASASDLTARMVSNRVCLALGVDGVAMQTVAHTLPVSILAMLAVFIPALICWRHGIMGGGDVKLFAATALLVHPAAVPMLVLAIALAGGVLGVSYWTMMHLLSRPTTSPPANPFRRILRVERHRICRGFSLPYAVAISIGTFYVLGKGLLS
ncbi:prepilin peptidase [Lichenicola cladoniae]|uniref:Prepilin peptidase n=1 Tax=Lichenicola cladoniae TaxID=1484109 RepID=A0A6M8HFF7_9PROT|nr:A24 family peptidase [Lichenicola cladoniae]NPD69203.1 prepilin peptidase [Acetobacteraceae bacterium]QKE89030.1 prepilin peptidase [Lichenicola cladoniae]